MNGDLPEPTPPQADVRDRRLMRWLIVACQATAILLTWPLWQVRHGDALPPNLPMLDSALLVRLQLPFGEMLLASLAMALLRPRFGSYCHAAMLATSIVLDQLRIQPEFISLAILLTGTVARRGPLLLARGHLVSLWLWAGLHKLLSPEYWQTTGPDLVQGLLPITGTRLAMSLGIAAAAVELSLGLAAMSRVSRRTVPSAAAALHLVVLVTLIARNWNTAVWPWNLALAVAGYEFFADWREPLWPNIAPKPLPIAAAIEPAASIRSPNAARQLLITAAFAAWMFYPALFYLNLCDGYLAWCIYSSNVPEAVIYDAAAPEGELLFDRAYTSLNVPFSPAVRLFEQYFRRCGKRHDRLEIADPRPLSRWTGRGEQRLIYTSDGPIEVSQ